MKKIRVLIVDDSAVVRMVLSKALNKCKDIEVVSTANDPYIARDKILRFKPDVITLDVEMPRMDGLTFLKKIMAYFPTPVVMVSALTLRGCETTLSCLAAGAVDFVSKPSSFDVTSGSGQMIKELAEKIRIAAKAKVIKRSGVAGKTLNNIPQKKHALIKSTNKIIAIGASTGGTEALTNIISKMPADSPGILIVQHMPEKFTTSFANRLNTLSEMEVREASNNESIIPGLVLLAPGNYHMELKRQGARYFVQVDGGEPVNRHRPSVEVLFNSVAKYAGANSVGAILTGMGNDGAAGLLEMKKTGARTIAQDEESCIVFGMPKEAIMLGAADKIVPLDKVSSTILSML